jgi:GNAT superfamily N-acetyltransferase
MLEVRRLTTSEARQQVSALADVLVDCVEGGASVSFMWPFSKSAAEDFFKKVVEGMESGNRILVAAFSDSKLVGTVQILTALPPNQPHRAEIAKLLVHRVARGQGVGRCLMEEVERQARLARKNPACAGHRYGRRRRKTLHQAGLGESRSDTAVRTLPRWAVVRHDHLLESARQISGEFWERSEGARQLLQQPVTELDSVIEVCRAEPLVLAVGANVIEIAEGLRDAVSGDAGCPQSPAIGRSGFHDRDYE